MRPPIKHKPDAKATIQIVVPGAFKNRVAERAAEEGLSIAGWAYNALRMALEASEGLPAPPPAVAPVPTPVEVLRAYLGGSRVLTPCGRSVSCPGVEGVCEDVGGVVFCLECRIRLL